MQKLARLHVEVERHLEEFSYFLSLSEKGRQRFRNRVIQFLNKKTFTGRDGLAVDTRMQVSIAAAAVQLTFGLNTFLLDRYKHIWLYPQSFYYSLSKQWMKGYTSISGRIALSWEDFQKGYENGTDNYNLGLHEMAHALHETVLRGSADPTFEYYFIHWEESTKHHFEKLRSGSIQFLRKYGGTNEHEFFAVCVEHFFESPIEFKRHLPELYYHLSAVLYQDPSNIDGDYTIDLNGIRTFNATAKFPIPIDKINRSYRYKDWHWTLTLTLIGLFFSTIMLATLSEKILLTGTQIVLAVMAAGSFSMFHVHRLKRENAMPAIPIFIMYAIFGIGVNAALLLFTVNNLQTNNESVKNYKVLKQTRVDDMYVYNLEFGAFNDFESVRSMHYLERVGSGIPDSLQIKTARGLLGLPVHVHTVDVSKVK